MEKRPIFDLALKTDCGSLDEVKVRRAHSLGVAPTPDETWDLNQNRYDSLPNHYSEISREFEVL